MHDYFISCNFLSLSVLRAVFGVWINVCFVVIAVCLRYLFRYRIKRTLFSGTRRINLWRISPAVTTSDIYDLRYVLFRALKHGQFFFVFVSFFCVVPAIIGAASTVISNYSVVSNHVIVDAVVRGQNVTHWQNSMEGAMAEVSSRVKALDLANAPLNELFDFAPDDDVHWIYQENQWHNTWKGNCTFSKHEAVELVVYTTNSTEYQIEVPLLGNYIPVWATKNATNQGTAYAGFYRDPTKNITGSWTDIVTTYFFGLAPDNDITFPVMTANISIVNYLAHEIGRDPAGSFIETAFRSDVHVAECAFVNSLESDSEYQANAAGGSYFSAAKAIQQMFVREVVMTSAARQPVIQRTGMQMLRYWQAYMSVKDTQYPNPDVRTLSSVHNIVQIRLSSLLVTLSLFLFAVVTAGTTKCNEKKNQMNKIKLPSSQLDWMVQAAREHENVTTGADMTARGGRNKSSNDFAIRNLDRFFIVSANLDDVSIDSQPPNSGWDWSEMQMASKSHGSQSDDGEEFDPWANYSQIRLSQFGK